MNSYRNFIDYPTSRPVIKKKRNATADSTAPASQSFFEKNKKAIMIGGAIIIIGLLLVPDVYLRKYIPWVK